MFWIGAGPRCFKVRKMEMDTASQSPPLGCDSRRPLSEEPRTRTGGWFDLAFIRRNIARRNNGHELIVDASGQVRSGRYQVNDAVGETLSGLSEAVGSNVYGHPAPFALGTSGGG